MKKVTAIFLSLILALSLAGCTRGGTTSPSPSPSASPSADGGSNGGTNGGNGSNEGAGGTNGGTSASVDFGESVTLKVWAPQEEQVLLSEMVDDFKEQYPNTEWNITFGVVSEGDAATRYLEDPQAAADVFMSENGQLRRLVGAGALYEVAGVYGDFVSSENGAGAVEAVTLNDRIYAFPMTADNGYFLYYDKSVITDVSTLDGILEQAQAAGKRVLMDLSNGYYLASFFLGAGGQMWIDENGKQQLDFNNATGLKAAEAAKAFAEHPASMTGDDSIIVGGIGDSIAAAVTGTWNMEAIEDELDEDFGAAKLPTFTLDGEQVQMSSFGGYKMVGVNSLTRYPDAAMALAQWLTNERNQLRRFEERNLGPSNTAAAQNEAVLANVGLAAYAEQSQFAVSQNNVSEAFWVPSEALGLALETGDESMTLQEQLDAMVAQITG